MKPDPQGPADTTMMGVVHDAYRRDLDRARAALSTKPYPNDQQRHAIAGHLLWLMDLLHHHHTGEDEGLWPLVLRKNPEAAAIMETMDADHAKIAPAMEGLQAAAVNYGNDGSDSARAAVLGAVDTLCEVVLPHLRREEDEAMPVVSASITAAEWDAWDQEHNIKPKPITQLGPEAHWVIDSLDPERYRHAVGLLPAVPRFIVLNAFRGQYRRRATAAWGPGDYGPTAER